MLADLDKASRRAEKNARTEHKGTLCIGRSHGIHAEPTTFGLKLCRPLRRLRPRQKTPRRPRAKTLPSAPFPARSAPTPLSTRKSRLMWPRIWACAPKPLPHKSSRVTVTPCFFCTLGDHRFSSIENLAIEIRHLQRTEVREAEEFFSEKAKKAPPLCRINAIRFYRENLTGLARVVRATVTPALENVALWHERDISHSSVERNIGPDACVTLDFALNRLSGLIENLLVYPDTMIENLEKMGGLVFSQRVLLALTQAGISREDAYRIVQRNAMEVWGTKGKTKLLEMLLKDKDVTAKMNEDEIKTIFDYGAYTKHVESIINRALES